MQDDNQLVQVDITADTVQQFAETIVKSGLAPASFNTKEKVLMALIYGKELGISAMQSLQGLTVINGKIGIGGDLAKALCEADPSCVGIDDELVHDESNPDRTLARVTVTRKGRPECVRTFSVGDAKKANLWGKTGRDGQPTPWITYPKRMLYYRALGFALRDAFPNVLKGLKTSEELQDYPLTGPDLIRTASEEARTFARNRLPEPEIIAATTELSVEPTRRRGRPPGSKNKEKHEESQTIEQGEATAEPASKGHTDPHQSVAAEGTSNGGTNIPPVVEEHVRDVAENQNDRKIAAVAKIREYLERDKISESRLMAQMVTWRFQPADATKLEEYSDADLELVGKQWSQLTQYVKKG